MNKAIHTKKIQSSTLVEVLVGMVIIMLTISLVFPLILKTQKESAIIERTEAVLIGNSVLEELIYTDTYKYTGDQFTIETNVGNDIVQEGGKVYSVSVTNSKGKELYSQERYVFRK